MRKSSHKEKEFFVHITVLFFHLSGLLAWFCQNLKFSRSFQIVKNFLHFEEKFKPVFGPNFFVSRHDRNCTWYALHGIFEKNWRHTVWTTLLQTKFLKICRDSPKNQSWFTFLVFQLHFHFYLLFLHHLLSIHCTAITDRNEKLPISTWN